METLGEKAKRGGGTYTIDFEVMPHMLTPLLMDGVDINTVQYLAGHGHMIPMEL